MIRAAFGILTFALGMLAAGRPAVAQGPVVIRDVRVFDGERVTDRRTVLLRDGRIARVGGSEVEVPADASVIDGTGRTLMPGMIDAHVHLSETAEADLRQAIVLGVTTVLDMFNAPPRLKRIKAIRAADAPGLADLRTAGIGAAVPGGHPAQMGGPPFPLIRAASEAPAFVEARVAEGSDYLKIIYDDLASFGMKVPMMDRETLAALIAAAHRHGLLAVVHVLSETQARDAIAAGADGLVHLATGETVSPDFGAFVAAHRVFVIPTLIVSHSGCGRPVAPALLADSALGRWIDPRWREWMTAPPRRPGKPSACVGTDEAVKQLARRKVPILAGTDAPAAGQTYGASIHAELEALVGVGMSPIEALTAATATTAGAFRLDDRGRIREGLRADLVLVEGNPTVNIRDSRRIVAVWKRGIPVRRE